MEIQYDISKEVPGLGLLQGSNSYIWPDAESLKGQGAEILETDQDGTPLVILWTGTGKMSFNSERLSLEECVERMHLARYLMKEAAKAVRKARGFGNSESR